MNQRSEPDLSQLGAIGDPFADAASAPPRVPLEPPRVPGGDKASPTRARVRMVRWIAFVAALVFEVPCVVLSHHRRDMTALPLPEFAVGLLLPLAAAAVALLAATRRGPRGLGMPARAIITLAVAAPALFYLVTMAGAPAAGADPDFWLHAAKCAYTTAFLTVGPLLLGLWAFRRSFAAAAAWRTAALGVAAGCLAATAMSIACPMAGAAHVILGHGLMMLVAGFAGALLAPAISRS
jgi:hypothetical protein